jgi:hypothetical protein
MVVQDIDVHHGPVDTVGPGVLSEDRTAHHLLPQQVKVPKAERGAWADTSQYQELVANITGSMHSLDEDSMRTHLTQKLARLIPYKGSFIINTVRFLPPLLFKCHPTLAHLRDSNLNYHVIHLPPGDCVE